MHLQKLRPEGIGVEHRMATRIEERSVSEEKYPYAHNDFQSVKISPTSMLCFLSLFLLRCVIAMCTDGYGVENVRHAITKASQPIHMALCMGFLADGISDLDSCPSVHLAC